MAEDIENFELSEDESDILTDQDQTSIAPQPGDDLLGAGPVGQDLENEPDDFMEGNVDVRTQMERAIRAEARAVSGHHNLDEPEPNHGGLDDIEEGHIPGRAATETDPEIEAAEDGGEDVMLPTDELEKIADENTMSLGELGETSLEAAVASGYTEEGNLQL